MKFFSRHVDGQWLMAPIEKRDSSIGDWKKESREPPTWIISRRKNNRRGRPVDDSGLEKRLEATRPRHVAETRVSSCSSTSHELKDTV